MPSVTDVPCFPSSNTHPGSGMDADNAVRAVGAGAHSGGAQPPPAPPSHNSGSSLQPPQAPPSN
eukprot:212362-Pelagomonas_calceolata.AAC.1